MIKRIEVLDGDTGQTTLRLNLHNPLSIMAKHDVPLAEYTDLTLANVLRYAEHIYDSLVWTPTDGGYRTTVIYGRFRTWLYTDQLPTNTQE